MSNEQVGRTFYDDYILYSLAILSVLVIYCFSFKPIFIKIPRSFVNHLNSNLSNAMAAGSAGNGTDPETKINLEKIRRCSKTTESNVKKAQNCSFSLLHLPLSFLILYITSIPGMDVVAEGTQGLGRQSFVGLPPSSPSASGSSNCVYESFATVGEIRVWWRADFQSGSRVLKKVF